MVRFLGDVSFFLNNIKRFWQCFSVVFGFVQCFHVFSFFWCFEKNIFLGI